MLFKAKLAHVCGCILSTQRVKAAAEVNSCTRCALFRSFARNYVKSANVKWNRLILANTPVWYLAKIIFQVLNRTEHHKHWSYNASFQRANQAPITNKHCMASGVAMQKMWGVGTTDYSPFNRNLKPKVLALSANAKSG